MASPTPPGQQHGLSDQEILIRLKKADEEVDGNLSSNDLKEISYLPSIRTIRSRFGKWNKAKKEAGLETVEKGDRVSLECDKCGDGFTRQRSSLSDTKYNFCSRDCGYSFIRGEDKPEAWKSNNDTDAWNPAKNKPSVLDKDENHFIDIECMQCGKNIKKNRDYFDKTANHFCSRDCSAQYFSDNYSGESSPFWEGGADKYYGPFWERKRRKAIERDGNKCNICGRKREDLSKDLHVHHDVPLDRFDNYEEANKLDNLMTLCAFCHNSLETGIYGMTIKSITAFL